MTVFTPVQRRQMRLRMALQGPAGSGKTFTALTVLRGLLGEGGKFAVVDADKRAREYGVLGPEDPETQFKFRFGHMIPDLTDPEHLPRLLAAAAAEGYGGILIDSFSHYWSGFGGALDRVDRSRDKRAGWSEYRPVEKTMMAALLSFPGHVIVTMRVRTEHVTEENENGRKTTKRLGMKADQRDNADYEFSVIGEMDTSHTLTVIKTTCQELMDQRINRPGQPMVDTLAAWLGEGEPDTTVTDLRDEAIDPWASRDDLFALLKRVEQQGLLNAPVTDDEGSPTTLGELIKVKGREAAAREAAAKQHAESGEAVPA